MHEASVAFRPAGEAGVIEGSGVVSPTAVLQLEQKRASLESAPPHFVQSRLVSLTTGTLHSTAVLRYLTQVTICPRRRRRSNSARNAAFCSRSAAFSRTSTAICATISPGFSA